MRIVPKKSARFKRIEIPYANSINNRLSLSRKVRIGDFHRTAIDNDDEGIISAKRTLNPVLLNYLERLFLFAIDCNVL